MKNRKNMDFIEELQNEIIKKGFMKRFQELGYYNPKFEYNDEEDNLKIFFNYKYEYIEINNTSEITLTGVGTLIFINDGHAGFFVEKLDEEHIPAEFKTDELETINNFIYTIGNYLLCY